MTGRRRATRPGMDSSPAASRPPGRELVRLLSKLRPAGSPLGSAASLYFLSWLLFQLGLPAEGGAWRALPPPQAPLPVCPQRNTEPGPRLWPAKRRGLSGPSEAPGRRVIPSEGPGSVPALPELPSGSLARPRPLGPRTLRARHHSACSMAWSRIRALQVLEALPLQPSPSAGPALLLF